MRRKFAATLQEAIAALAEPHNIAKDAFAILEERFPTQHSSYLLALSASGPIKKIRLRRAWRAYYSDEGADEQEWWLPNEYGTVLSNKPGNTDENTRSLATRRLEVLIAICV